MHLQRGLVPFGRGSPAPLQQRSAVPVRVEIILWPNYCLDLLPINTWLQCREITCLSMQPALGGTSVPGDGEPEGRQWGSSVSMRRWQMCS